MKPETTDTQSSEPDVPAPHADPSYDEPGDNPMAAEDDDD
jgi:hypothetical protein